jgi:RNA polymerase sigma-70 factor (ECF subfamily)
MNAKMADQSDESLVEVAKKGNVDAFAELARRYQEKVYYTIFGFTRNHTDADDLAQETFMYAYKSLKGFKQKSSFYTWIYRIAVNLTLNHLKKMKKEKGRENLRENLSPLEDSSASSFSPERHSIKHELQDQLEKAIDSLPLPYKSAFSLVVLEGMSHGQAAQVLGCSENTISWRMHKARKMLQAQLKSYFNEVKNEL